MHEIIENLPAISSKLAGLYKERAALQIANRPTRVALDERKLQLIPPGGWPGKNADERAAVEKSTYSTDPTMKDLQAKLWQADDREESIAAQIDALEAERRAGEHMIYAMMADALSGLRSRSNASALGPSAVKDSAKYAIAEATKQEIANAVIDGAGEQVEVMTPGEQADFDRMVNGLEADKSQPVVLISQPMPDQIPF